MDWNPEEKEIAELMSRVRIPSPPKSTLNDFEFEVHKKIMRRTESFGIQSGAAVLVLAFVLGLVIIHFLQVSRIKNQAPLPDAAVSKYQEIHQPSMIAPVPVQNLVAERETSLPKKPAANFEKLSNDLFILELLGEDEGVYENPNLIASDIHMIIQSGQAI